MLEKEKQFLKDNRKRYNQPWIVIMSDGRATPSRLCWNQYTRKKDCQFAIDKYNSMWYNIIVVVEYVDTQRESQIYLLDKS